MNRNYSNISYAESPFGTLSEFMSKSFGWMFEACLSRSASALERLRPD